MPAEYEAIKKSLRNQGKSLKEAKRIASATFIKRHPGRAKELHHKKRK